MEFKKCMLVAGLVTWYVYETYMCVPCFLSLPISQNELWLFKVWVSILDSYFTADKLQSHSASFGTMLTWERKTEPSSHPVLQSVPCFNGEKKCLQSCEAQRKSIHGWFFHTSGPSPYHLSPNEAHSLSTSPLLRRWRRAQIAKIYQVCRWSIHVPQWNASVTNDELLTSGEWSCHHHSQIQLACM